ncbi:histone-like nucleoid-structuring protein, MvaT/MvaU family [Pseudomonas sp. NPDC089758]|uniref:histone-like nucleoid-structuring protein, MvaT/MvaU family n=1 Tax=Pseudomonas sp. NPDC089758 TaxID=3364473 RepID=UPI0038260D15
MSRLAEFRALERQLAAQLAELESLENDDGLKREIEFEQKLRGLLGEYGYSLRQVVVILDPHAASRIALVAREPKGNRKPRQVKRYKNPHSGEVVETKGGNQKILKEWKSEYGSDTLESRLAE